MLSQNTSVMPSILTTTVNAFCILCKCQPVNSNSRNTPQAKHFSRIPSCLLPTIFRIPSSIRLLFRYTALTPYGYHLESARSEEDPLAQADYEKLLGSKERYPDLLRFFNGQVEEHGMDAVLAEFMPRLIQGAAGALTHGIIHLGWGLDGESRWMATEGTFFPYHVAFSGNLGLYARLFVDQRCIDRVSSADLT